MPLAGLESLTGTTIEVVVGEPATFDAAGYKALSWAQVVGTVSFGEWGDTENDVAEPLLSAGRNIHQNGLSDGGEVSISVQHRDTDAGSDIIKANGGSNTIVSIKKTYASGDVECATGVLSSHRQREGSNDTVRGYTSTARINTQVYEFDSAAWAAA